MIVLARDWDAPKILCGPLIETLQKAVHSWGLNLIDLLWYWHRHCMIMVVVGGCCKWSLSLASRQHLSYVDGRREVVLLRTGTQGVRKQEKTRMSYQYYWPWHFGDRYWWLLLSHQMTPAFHEWGICCVLVTVFRLCGAGHVNLCQENAAGHRYPACWGSSVNHDCMKIMNLMNRGLILMKRREYWVTSWKKQNTHFLIFSLSCILLPFSLMFIKVLSEANIDNESWQQTCVTATLVMK